MASICGSGVPMFEQTHSTLDDGHECVFVFARERVSVGRLSAALDCWLPDCGVPEPVLRSMQVICDEVLANALDHCGGVEAPVHLRMAVAQHRVVAQFAYLGHSFDPQAKPKPDVHTPVSLRDMGGLGIHLIKSLSDLFEYHYRDGHHCLRIEKQYAD